MVEVLNKETVKSVRTKPPSVQIFERGQIRFSVEASKLLSLKAGDKIEFLISRQDDEIIYFCKSDKGFELKKELTPGKLERLLVLCRPLCKKLFMFFGLKKSTTFDITNELADFYGRKCWCLFFSY